MSITLSLQVRSMISDYAVILAILVFASIDNAFHLQTPKLIVPTVFKVTTVQNHYLVNTRNRFFILMPVKSRYMKKITIFLFSQLVQHVDGSFLGCMKVWSGICTSLQPFLRYCWQFYYLWISKSQQSL